MQQLAEDQRQELELAIIKRGKYQLQPQYRYLEVPEAKWFSLTQDQRQAHLKKFAHVRVLVQRLLFVTCTLLVLLQVCRMAWNEDMVKVRCITMLSIVRC